MEKSGPSSTSEVEPETAGEQEAPGEPEAAGEQEAPGEIAGEATERQAERNAAFSTTNSETRFSKLNKR